LVREFPNRLLKRLPGAARQSIEDGCSRVELTLGHVVTEMGQRLAHVYFPCGAFISQVVTVQGREIGVGLVGDEGMYGIQAGLDIEDSPVRAVVQCPGPALRMAVDDFRARLRQTAPLRDLVSRYTFFVYSQAMRSAACSRFHVMEQRLARWLLLSADRAHAESFQTTQRFVAAMLGVRRVGVTEAIGELQGRELIAYTRGRVRILDRTGLEKIACGCYRHDISTYRRALGSASHEA
jgi:CRP-like cAMP-binding protein